MTVLDSFRNLLSLLMESDKTLNGLLKQIDISENLMKNEENDYFKRNYELLHSVYLKAASEITSAEKLVADVNKAAMKQILEKFAEMPEKDES